MTVGNVWSDAKKMQNVLNQIKNVRGLSEHEKLLFARNLAAIPDERWKLHTSFLRALDLFKRYRSPHQKHHSQQKACRSHQGHGAYPRLKSRLHGKKR